MGTLSGRGNIIISVGKNSLIANAGIGIPLGDACKVEASLYITAGTKIAVLDDRGEVVKTVRVGSWPARTTFCSAAIPKMVGSEVVLNKTAIQLNETLHAHN